MVSSSTVYGSEFFMRTHEQFGTFFVNKPNNQKQKKNGQANHDKPGILLRKTATEYFTQQLPELTCESTRKY